MRGGRRENAGRKPGAKDKLARKMREAIPTAQELIGVGPTPLEFLLSVMRDEREDTSMRVQAAKGACEYVHRRQPQAHEVHSDVEFGGIEFIVPGLK